MCGRYAAFREAQDLAAEFDVEDVDERAAAREPSWNLAPTDPARVILDRPATAERAEIREMHLARWGLLPAFTKDPKRGAPLFNARIETVAEKPAFRKSLAARRCLVPADGYFEWRTEQSEGGGKSTKTPFFIHATGGEGGARPSLAFAGLYAWWRDPSKEEDDPDRWVLSTTIITTQARDGLEAIHDREPVVLSREAVDAWLEPGERDAEASLEILRSPGPELSWYEVGTAVGSIRNNHAGLVHPA